MTVTVRVWLICALVGAAACIPLAAFNAPAVSYVGMTAALCVVAVTAVARGHQMQAAGGPTLDLPALPAVPDAYAASAPAAGHDHGQDMVLVDAGRGIIGLFDGGSGAPGSQHAASAALQSVKLAAEMDGEPAGWTGRAARAAGRALQDVKRAEPRLARMTTTAVIARFVSPDLLEVSWCGNSRAWRWNPAGGLELLTEDHDLLSALRDGRLIGVEQADSVRAAVDASACARDARRQAGLLGWLAFRTRGTLWSQLAEARPRIDTRRVGWAPADLLVLTSDGVHDVLTAEQIDSTLQLAVRRGDRPAAELVAEAQRAGSTHDCTCVVLNAPGGS